MRKFLMVIMMSGLLLSCGNSKTLEINGKKEFVSPYGWFDTTDKNDCVYYKIVTGNIVGSVLSSPSFILPILITGIELWEPVSVKPECQQ